MVNSWIIGSLTARRLARSFPVTGAVFVTSPYSGVTLRVVAATKHSCRHVTLTTNTGRDVIVDDTQKVQWKRTR